MFSFIKKYATTISGIDMYPNISLMIFMAVFIGMIVFVVKANKKYIQELENIPFRD